MVLSAALTRAHARGPSDLQFAHNVELPSWRRKEIRPWAGRTAPTLPGCARKTNPCTQFPTLGLYGLRRGEVLGLRWQDINLASGRLHIRQQLQRYGGDLHLRPTKTAAGERDLPLLEPARRSTYRHPTGRRPTHTRLVFLTRFDNPIDSGNATGFPDKSVGSRPAAHHAAPSRHTAATLLKNTGVPARDAQLMLGHAHITQLSSSTSTPT